MEGWCVCKGGMCVGWCVWKGGVCEMVVYM